MLLKLFIVFFLLTLQAAAIALPVVFYNYLSPYLLYILMAVFIINFIMTIIIINHPTNPHCTILWLSVALLIPPSGWLVFFIFFKNRLSKKEKSRLRQYQEGFIKYINKNNPFREELKKQGGDVFGQSEYLLKWGKLPVYNDSFCKYYGENSNFFIDLLSELRKAERFIFIEYFSIKTGVMWNSILEILKEKAKQGVEVRLMYDFYGCFGTLPLGYYKKLKKMGIKCVSFKRYLPLFSSLNNNRNHRKMVIIDGLTAFTGGGNLADEYVNITKRFGHWKDSAVMLKGNAVNSLTLMFLQIYNAQKVCDNNFYPYLVNHSRYNQGGFIQPFANAPTPFCMEKTGESAIINILYSAKDYVYISTPYLIIDYHLQRALKNAAGRGVDVRIFTPGVPDKKAIYLLTRSAFKPLIESGVKIFSYSKGFLHSKNILCDGKVGIVGTINLDFRSLVHHFECGVWMYNTAALNDLKKDFDNITTVSNMVSLQQAKLSFFDTMLKSILQFLSPML